MKNCALALLLLSLAAQAQQVPHSDIEQVWLDPAARGSLIVGNGTTLPQGKFRVGLGLFYTYGNLRTAESSAATPLLSDRLGTQVFAAVGLFDWLELGLSLPVVFYQRADPALNVSPAGLINPWLFAKAQILGKNDPISLAFGVGVGLPVGLPVSAQTNGGVEFAPRVQLGKVFQTWQFGVEVGFLWRAITDYAPVSFAPVGDAPGNLVGNQLWAGLMVATVNRTGPRGEFSLRGHVPVGYAARAGLEAQLGVRVPVGDFEFFASAGPGFGGEPQTPLARVYLGIAFGNEPLTSAPCVEGEPYELLDCPDLDLDGDGVRNADDGAPNEPEDFDGFQDEDGVPDPDNDGDGVLDADDACPNVAGSLREKGCPDKDGDEDGVPDYLDNCPGEAGPKENQGCPADKKQLVVITETKLVILDRVYFNTGRATIQARSNALLDNMASVLASHAEVRVQIEGHTDNTGNADKNKKLSQERADAVRSYLLKKGIAAERLTAVGFGQEKPAQPNETPEGRDANRRVEFTVL